MSNEDRGSRVVRLLATARSQPEFAQRLAMQLPAPMRLVLVDELSRQPTTPRPGVKKCQPKAPPMETGMSAQLNLFARSVSRVR